MTEKLNLGGLPTTRKKYTPALKAECVHQVAAGARQSDVARAPGISPALLGRWHAWRCQRLSSAERAESKHLRAELRRVEMARDILKKAVTVGMLQPRYPDRLGHEPLRFHCSPHRALARAGALPLVGREHGRLVM